MLLSSAWQKPVSSLLAVLAEEDEKGREETTLTALRIHSNCRWSLGTNDKVNNLINNETADLEGRREKIFIRKYFETDSVNIFWKRLTILLNNWNSVLYCWEPLSWTFSLTESSRIQIQCNFLSISFIPFRCHDLYHYLE